MRTVRPTTFQEFEYLTSDQARLGMQRGQGLEREIVFQARLWPVFSVEFGASVERGQQDDLVERLETVATPDNLQGT